MINALGREINENAHAKGFYETERNIGEMLMLTVSELGEALEADRTEKYCALDNYGKGLVERQFDSSFNEMFKILVKDTFEDELADTCIRLFDLAHMKGIDLEWHIRQKMRYNSLRPYKHGKKY